MKVMLAPSILYLHRLRKQQWMPLERLQEIQNEKLRRIINHAYNNVPYYRRLFDSTGIEPADIQTVEDLRKIPKTTKRQIQALPPEEIVARGIDQKRCRVEHTSGSTGIPLNVYRSSGDAMHYDMIRVRTHTESGQRLLDRIVTFRSEPMRRLWFENLGILRKYVILSSDNIDSQIEALRRVKPHVARGYTSHLLVVASAIREKGIRDVSIRRIFTTGTIMDPESRRQIESAMGAEVYDSYGTMEIGVGAWECEERKGYHMNMDSVVMELEKDGRPAEPGEPGSIICTTLGAYAMPFIRYDIGDTAVASARECSCGRRTPLLERIEGRTDDLLIGPDGSYYSSPGFMLNARLVPGIGQFRLTQETLRDVIMEIVPAEGFSGDTVQSLKKKMEELLGKDFNVKIVVVDEIPADPSGKVRSIVSRVRKQV